MWHPEPGWQQLPGGAGPSTYGVWAAVVDGRDCVVKRLVRPVPGDPTELSTPRSFAWWRREVDVAQDGTVADTPGVRGARVHAVDEDADGATLVLERVDATHNPGPFLARALGRLAATAVPDRGWLARDQLRDRLARVEHRGGWPTLGRVLVADIADHLWRRRFHHLDALDALPQVLQHGDPTPGNLTGRDGDTVVGVDWSCLGTGAVGADAGLLALASKEDLEVLLDAYVTGVGDVALRGDALYAARVTVAYTALSRAEWALARAAAGEGALAGKFRHPSVAPYLRALQRQLPQITALIG